MEPIFQIGITLCRTLFSYIFLLFLTRIMGRKQITQLTFFDYVTGITIGSIAAAIAIGPMGDFYLGILSLSAWTFSIMTTNYLTKNSVAARKLVESYPIMVIYQGKILEETLGKMNYTIDNLFMELRNKDIFDPAEVDIAILEPNGQLSIKKSFSASHVTNQDLRLPEPPTALSPFTGLQLIVDGILIKENLQRSGLSLLWLRQQLKVQGLNDLSQVITALIRSDGSLYFDTRHDSLP